MRKLLFFIPVAAIIYFSCNTSNTTPVLNLLKTDSLPVQNFVIDINTDTLLHTSNGTWIKIDKGTFSSSNGKVALEIKEALSMQQIIKAGLVTAAGGQALSSGGMICINPAAGQNVTINKPFKVAVPTTAFDKNMQLYKGKISPDGTVDWKDPKAVDESSQMTALEKGEMLFQQKCASCHGIGKEGSGPDLAHVWKRAQRFWGGEGSYGFGPEFLDHQFKKRHVSYDTSYGETDSGMPAYVDSFVHPAHPYACNLINLFNNQEIELSADVNKNKADWFKIYQYIENESDRQNLPYPRHAYLDSCIDSCRLYEMAKSNLNKKRLLELIKRERFIEENGQLVERKPDPAWGVNNNLPPAGFTKNEKVEPNDYPATYYQFTIETFGWFNIDMLLAKKDGVAESELFVRVVGTIREKIKIYLIIPSAKVLGEGGPAEKDKELYAFFYKTGSIPLPQNVKAYILAVTETGKSIAYGLKEFTTQTKQQFDISLNESTKQEFDKAIESIGADKLSITVSDSKNADSIRVVDKKIKELEEGLKNAEKLKPTRCDCECGQPNTAPVADVASDNLNSLINIAEPDDKQ